MKYGKLALILCLIGALLLTGCNKQPAETPQVPETPAEPSPPGSSGPSQPATTPEPPVAPLQPPLTEDEEALLEAALLREEMAKYANVETRTIERNLKTLKEKGVSNEIIIAMMHSRKAAQEKAEVKETVELPMEATNLYTDTADYIKSIVLSLGMEKCDITEMSNEEEIHFEIDCGDDYGIIIGKRGETLDAIQYLARMVANKGKSSYKRVSINVGNYRAKREETLQILARKTAMRAVRQGRNISLEPMNPYERRIIHTAVQEVEGATSHSVGSDLDRRVVISPVEGARNNGGRGRNNRNGGRRERKEAYKPEISPDRAPKSDIDGASLYGKVEIRSVNTEE